MVYEAPPPGTDPTRPNAPVSRGIEVTLTDLMDWSRGPLSPIAEAIEASWVAGHPERSYSVRCGTAYLHDNEGNAEIRIVLRFPLDV